MHQKLVAIVSGGNRGMGLTTCEKLAQQGFTVLLGSRSVEAGQAAIARIDPGSGDIEVVQLDVGIQSEIDELGTLVDRKYGRVDVLVNNAGILIDAPLGQPASILDASPDLLAESFNINTIGVVRLSNRMIPLMRAGGGGRIINISSGMGQLSDMGAGYAGYRISKTALNSVTAIYANELAGTGIAVNAVCPGWVATDMGGANAERTLEQGVDTALWLATEADSSLSGGYYRDRKIIPW